MKAFATELIVQLVAAGFVLGMLIGHLVTKGGIQWIS